MNSFRRIILLWASLSIATGAVQAETYQFAFAKDSTNNWACDRATPTGRVSADPLNQVVVNVEVRGSSVPADTTVALVGGGLATPMQLSPSDKTKTKWGLSKPLPVSELIRGKDIHVEATLDTKTIDCNGFTPGQGTPSIGGASEQQKFDGLALKWWADNGAAALDKLRTNLKYPPNTVFLPHLPSGSAAPNNRESAPETALLQVVVLSPLAGPETTYEVKINNCPDRVPFRIEGNVSTLGQQNSERAIEFQVVPVAKPFQCGEGNLAYSVRPVAEGDQAMDATFRLRPVYHLATTFSYGFDFVKDSTFSVESMKVVRSKDNIGTGLRVGFTWFPWGVDFEEMRWYNHWINPALLVDTKAPTENFIIGDAITPSGGLSIIIGAAIHKITELRGINAGDSFTGTGDVPTRKAWSRDGIGWYVGVALDDNVFGKLKNAFKIGK
jgi:hypothetical protein